MYGCHIPRCVSASMAQSRWPARPVCYLATVVFPRVCTVVFPRVCTVVFSYSTVVLVCLQFLGPAHVDLFTQLSNNKFCSIVTHIHHHKTCSITTHAQSHLMLRTRMAAKRKCTEKNAFFASCSSSSSAHVAVELDSIFASAKHRETGFEKVDLIVHGKMSFLVSRKYVKIRLQLQILCCYYPRAQASRVM